MVERFGPTTGLPIFQDENKSVPKKVTAILDTAPKAMFYGTDTRKLGEMAAKFDELALSEKQRKVIEAMLTAVDWSFQELARKLGWSVNRVVPRVFELRQLGLVVPSRKRECSITGFVVNAWEVKCSTW